MNSDRWTIFGDEVTDVQSPRAGGSETMPHTHEPDTRGLETFGAGSNVLFSRGVRERDPSSRRFSTGELPRRGSHTQTHAHAHSVRLAPCALPLASFVCRVASVPVGRGAAARVAVAVAVAIEAMGVLTHTPSLWPEA